MRTSAWEGVCGTLKLSVLTGAPMFSSFSQWTLTIWRWQPQFSLQGTAYGTNLLNLVYELFQARWKPFKFPGGVFSVPRTVSPEGRTWTSDHSRTVPFEHCWFRKTGKIIHRLVILQLGVFLYCSFNLVLLVFALFLFSWYPLIFYVCWLSTTSSKKKSLLWSLPVVSFWGLKRRAMFSVLFCYLFFGGPFYMQ